MHFLVDKKMTFLWDMSCDISIKHFHLTFYLTCPLTRHFTFSPDIFIWPIKWHFPPHLPLTSGLPSEAFPHFHITCIMLKCYLTWLLTCSYDFWEFHVVWHVFYHFLQQFSGHQTGASSANHKRHTGAGGGEERKRRGGRYRRSCNIKPGYSSTEILGNDASAV